MDKKGKRVFGDNIDAILSDKIIEHTELTDFSDTKQTMTKPIKKSPAKLLIPTLFVSAVLILILKYFSSNKQK